MDNTRFELCTNSLVEGTCDRAEPHGGTHHNMYAITRIKRFHEENLRKMSQGSDPDMFALTIAFISSGASGFKGGSRIGHSLGTQESQEGPFHHRSRSPISAADTPREAMSAGFDDPGTCRQDTFGNLS